jgi:guanylate kinase
VVSAPSGGGKTSIINALLKLDPGVSLSVSHTTRPPRPAEEDGVHYFFTDEADFLNLVEKDAFLEHAMVFDHRYGTGRRAVERQLEAGFDVLLDIDWQGARQIRDSFPACCTVFIIPPSLEVLRQRLAERAQDSEEVIARRMRDARAEISHWGEFDFLLINDNFQDAVSDLQSIIRRGTPERKISDDRTREILANLLETR